MIGALDHAGPDSRPAPLVIAIVATLAILAPLAWLWQASLVPKAYSVTGMGYHDYGGGPARS